MLVKPSQSKLELDNCLSRTPRELTPIRGEAVFKCLLLKGELGAERHFLAEGLFLITASLTGGRIGTIPTGLIGLNEKLELALLGSLFQFPVGRGDQVGGPSGKLIGTLGSNKSLLLLLLV